jgi:hypothetical protein
VREKSKEQLINEVRNTNRAINIAAGVFNSLLTLKKELLIPLKDDWEKQKNEYLNHVERIRLGEISQDEKIDLVFNLQSLTLQRLPVDILQKQIFEKLSLTGRPLSLITSLIHAADILSIFVEKRNQLIESYKVKSNLTPSLYFGIRNLGQINEDYPSTIKNIYQMVSDGIFFSNLLCKDLMEHGKETRDRFRRLYDKEAPKVTTFDVLEENLSLIPGNDEYPDWIANFIKTPPS